LVGSPTNKQFASTLRYRLKMGVGLLSRVLKNKHQVVSQGARRFGKRSIFNDM